MFSPGILNPEGVMLSKTQGQLKNYPREDKSPGVAKVLRILQQQ